MRRVWISLVAAGLLTIAAIIPAAAQEIVTLQLEEVDDSGISGSVRLSPGDGETEVSILLTSGLEEGAAHPVHIHEGTCDDLGDVVYPLNDVADGASETTVDVDLMEIMTGEFAINAHRSEDAIDEYVACTNIPESDIDDAAEDVSTGGDNDAAADGEDAEDGDDEEEADDVMPATGSTGGMDTDTIAMVMVLLAGTTLGAGVLVRRQVARSYSN